MPNVKPVEEIGPGTELFCNGYPGKVKELCTGQLEGMAIVRLAGGDVCVSIVELNRFRDYDVRKVQNANRHIITCSCEPCRSLDGWPTPEELQPDTCQR